jgi:hypothetical protein
MGLRIALGSTPARLQRVIILENLILTTFAILPGLIVMANLYAFASKVLGMYSGSRCGYRADVVVFGVQRVVSRTAGGKSATGGCFAGESVTGLMERG